MDFRDNNQYRALVGTDVILGRRIRAKLRVGYEQKSFDKSANGSTFGKPVWQGSLEWALRRKSSVRVETGREIFELATVNTPVDTEKFNVQEWIRAVWRERWTDKLLTETSYTYRDTSFRGRNEQESGEQFLISAVYQVSSKLKLAFDGGYTREDSSFGTNLKRRTFTFRTDYSL
jgi:hypothetical protein